MPEPYAVVRFSMRAVIGEHTFNDVVQFATSFELNSIPEGTLTVAVGRNVVTQQAATIHSAIRDLRVQVPARVYLTAVVFDRDRVDANLFQFEVPGGKLIFEGYAVGTGWQRSEQSANFTIHLVHWLSGLHYASAISASSHPSNPYDWKYPAAFRAIGFASEASAGATDLGKQVSWVPQVRADDVTVDGMKEDLWGNILHKWLLHVAQDDPIETRLKEDAIAGGTKRARITLDAINRLKPNPAGTPLAVNLDGIDDTVVAEGLRLALQNEGGDSWLNTTLWGKLVGEWSPAYWFAVCPRVSDALIVPFAGGLQGEPWAQISDVDYNHCTANAQLHQVLRAVGIGFPINWATGADGLVGTTVADRTGVCGWFQPPGVTEGLVLIKAAPQWLCNPQIISKFTASSTGDIGSGPMSTAFDKDGTGTTPAGTPAAKSVQKRNKLIMDRFAQQWYAIEMLKGRQGELSGKLRFDIAPGTNVLIEAGTAKNVNANEDALTEDVFATVNRVSIAINAESQQAGTAFSIAHIRTATENRDSSTSVPVPPLYTKAWRGASLV